MCVLYTFVWNCEVDQVYGWVILCMMGLTHGYAVYVIPLVARA